MPTPRSPGNPADTAPDARIAFVLELGRALHAYGVAAPRLEEVLGTASRRLGLEGQFFTTPTSVFAGIGPVPNQHTFLLRVEPGGTDLGRLAQTDAVIRQVLDGAITPEAGVQQLAQIRRDPPTYRPAVTVLGFSLASGAAARFLGGGLPEIGVAVVLGALTGALSLRAATRPALDRVFEPVASFTVAFLAAFAAATWGGFSLATATLAGLIVLIPGMTLTTAMSELASRHLSSGTARVSAAAITFLGIGLGVTLGYRVAGLLVGLPMVAGPRLGLPSWANLIALVISGLGFTVLLKAERRDAIWIVVAGMVAFFGARLGGQVLGPELGVFLGALLVGLGSLGFERLTDRPAAIVEVPGLLTLVPGSVGFRSLLSMIDQEVISGVETAFRMVMIAVALVAGLLLAKLAAPRAAR